MKLKPIFLIILIFWAGCVLAQEKNEKNRMEIKGNISLLIKKEMVAFAEHGVIVGGKNQKFQNLKLDTNVAICDKDVLAKMDELLAVDGGNKITLLGDIVIMRNESGMMFADRADYDTVGKVMSIYPATGDQVSMYFKPEPTSDTIETDAVSLLDESALKEECKTKISSASAITKDWIESREKEYNIVRADRIRTDETMKQLIANGNVLIQYTSLSFSVTAENLKVEFDESSDLKSLIAKDNVTFTDPLRKGQSDNLIYLPESDKINLKGNVRLSSSDGVIEAEQIDITFKPEQIESAQPALDSLSSESE